MLPFFLSLLESFWKPLVFFCVLNEEGLGQLPTDLKLSTNPPAKQASKQTNKQATIHTRTNDIFFFFCLLFSLWLPCGSPLHLPVLQVSRSILPSLPIKRSCLPYGLRLLGSVESWDQSMPLGLTGEREIRPVPTMSEI